MSLQRKATAGVLSGFRIDLSSENTDVTVTPSIYTIDDAMTELQRIRQTLDPENVRYLQELIFQHTLDHNNPHNTTIGDLIQDVTRDALLDYMPGTVPQTSPTYAVHAAIADCSSIITHRSTSIQVTDATGHHVTIPPDQPTIDWGSGEPRLMAWSARTNQLTTNNPINNPSVSALAATLYTQQISSLRAPDRTQNYLVIKDHPTDDTHGIRLTLDVIAATEYVSSFYIYPWLSSGVITVSLGWLTGGDIQIDIATKLVTYDTNVIGYVEPLITGWLRIGIQYVAPTTGVQTVDVIYSQDITSRSYLGQEDDIFLFTCMMHGPGVGLGPYIPVNGGEVTVSGTTYECPVDGMLGSAAGMITLKATFSQTLVSSPVAIMTSAGFQLTHEQQNLLQMAFENSGTALNTAISALPQRIAYSYDQHTLKQLGTAQDRQAVTGTYTALADMSTLTLEASDTAYESLVFYNVAESGYALDFLTGVNSQ